MKIELNGKGLIAASLLAVSIVSASFVSVINADSAGGVVFATPEYSVGSVVFRMDDVNPSTIYGGTWKLIDSDASIRFGNGDIQSGNPIGENEEIVPLQEHDHSMNHDHPTVNTSTNTHSHTQYIGQAGSGSSNRIGWDIVHNLYSLATINQLNSVSHNHTVDIPNYTGKTSKSGETNAKIDVRGKYITINVWQKI